MNSFSDSAWLLASHTAQTNTVARVASDTYSLVRYRVTIETLHQDGQPYSSVALWTNSARSNKNPIVVAESEIGKLNEGMDPSGRIRR